ncbi:stealth family protein [Angustibacter sp. Root456]|uniref:stealth family protein n=1 Tax=Angustibacter sp. Root456 TaxID=1736539 RepID=UPI00138EED90|nr:stealth family protein [Angustibacter sp. Root456]
MAYRSLPAGVWTTARDLLHGESRVQRRVRQLRLARASRRQSGRFAVPVTAIEYRGERLLARVATSFRASEVLAANAALVLDALEKAGVPHVVVDAPLQRRRVVAIDRDQFDTALAALRVAAIGRPVYASWVSGRKNAPATSLGLVPRRRSADALRVFEPYASFDGDALAGVDFGCDLELWRRTDRDLSSLQLGEPVPAGALIAPRPNRWTETVHLGHGEPGVVEVDGVQRRGLPAAGQHHQFDVPFPVDVVYTWVDGDDPEWKARKQQAHQAAGLGTLHEFAVHDSRFKSRDELRYSLRSLDTYADWVRTVYLVTDDQVPDWLQLSHPKLRIVSHRELFADRGRLPTFNSHAIESQLHHLDGLSEHYLYLNDDVFFGRPVAPDVFFHSNGLAKFFTSQAKLGLGQSTPLDMPSMSAGKNSRDLLHKAFDVTPTNKYKHVAHSQRRSVLFELEERFPEIFSETASHQFRRETDYSIAASLHHMYAYQTGRAVPGRIRYEYADIAAAATPARLRRLLRTRDYDVFCLNDHDSSAMDPAAQAALMHGFLSSYLPLPSSFEK